MWSKWHIFPFAARCSAKTELNVNHYHGSMNTRSISNSVHLMINVHLTFFEKNQLVTHQKTNLSFRTHTQQTVVCTSAIFTLPYFA